jgi:hypothetical protein
VDNFFILRYMKGAGLSTKVQQLQQLWNRGLLLCTVYEYMCNFNMYQVCGSASI